ncbi:exodeoxyribonuclease VII small subunit [Phycicoccus sp. BSK3Z-2]|uniref:Exodeoxyribonuclease VII small subunit n=1 Tax=Phycicoccus avicenniae TaxID=2828860 RepID=A0A941DAU2_9MICO|nr:exodeoxyribonuclease VII small subunit [Phycicoccus avicenniae]MBR7743007.1 exodeoxyribonuclease VII small subunit [Phycicoccus avicenniae]
MPTDDAAPADAPATADTDVSSLGYEDARDQLVDIVARLESGQVGLEESMTLWQRAEALAAHCTQWLDRAEERIAASED